jgi:carboxylesterase
MNSQMVEALSLRKGTSTQFLNNPNSSKVVLLVHGFRGVPSNFNALTTALYEGGFSVYNLRLNGHGLMDHDGIFKVKLRDWESLVEHTYLDLKDKFQNVYTCGLSLGGSLLLNLALKYNEIKKMVVYSPMLKLKHRVSCLSGIIGFLKKKINISIVDCSIEHESFKDFIPFIPVPQVHELYKLTRSVRKSIRSLNANILCFLSINDHILDYHQIKKITDRTDFTVIDLEKSFHNSIVDVEQDLIIHKTIEWFKS